jgi:mRNA interferase RelE/StbE
LNYEISLSDEAKACLKSLDGKTRLTVARKIEALKETPEKQGKALTGDLTGYRSIHAAGRYRVIYQLSGGSPLVVVAAIGIRKEGSKIDVYETLKKLMRSKIFQ